MKELHFEGYSDDTFGEYKSFDDDFDNCASGDPIKWVVEARSGRLVVVGQYCASDINGWSIAVGTLMQDDTCDDEAVPDWPMRLERSEREYSPRLVIEAPDDVTITYLPEEK